MSQTVCILGCGYTGQRVAKALIARGLKVIVTTRSPSSLTLPGAQIVHFDAAGESSLSFIPEGARVLYSIPIPDPDCTEQITKALGKRRPARVVYLSTTGVYGDIRDVDATTEPAPVRPGDRSRIAAEHQILNEPWSAIVLRPAAIYGPDRGIHVSMQAGRYLLAGNGSNYVSRIHVADLARHCDAALFSDIRGAWPVADERPCTSLEIAEFCAGVFGVPMPLEAERDSLHHTRQANRKVNGAKIREMLGIDLVFPTYVEGIYDSMNLID